MNVRKEKNEKTWEVYFYTKDYTGKNHHRHKRGFRTKKEAIAYAEAERHKSTGDPRMTVATLIQLYEVYMKGRMRESTISNKKYIINSKILPKFGSRKVADIKEEEIVTWQNELIDSEYEDTYLRSINNQLSALFNFGEKTYHLPNPVKNVKKIGAEDADEMQYYTYEEFSNVINGVSDNPISTLQINMLYWTGMRIGELLALKISDIDLKEMKIRVKKTYYERSRTTSYGKPKTKTSYRYIDIPEFLRDDIQDYLNHLYGPRGNDRLFECSAKHIRNQFGKAIDAVGGKKIRIHDLRHSHASLLLAMGEEPLVVSRRLGHKNVDRLYKTYAHVFPGKGREMAARLNELAGGDKHAWNS